ncbi:hypothetical protein AHAS_Ahas12G0034500 [Arachis hypogaea]
MIVVASTIQGESMAKPLASGARRKVIIQVHVWRKRKPKLDSQAVQQKQEKLINNQKESAIIMPNIAFRAPQPRLNVPFRASHVKSNDNDQGAPRSSQIRRPLVVLQETISAVSQAIATRFIDFMPIPRFAQNLASRSPPS